MRRGPLSHSERRAVWRQKPKPPALSQQLWRAGRARESRAPCAHPLCPWVHLAPHAYPFQESGEADSVQDLSCSFPSLPQEPRYILMRRKPEVFSRGSQARTSLRRTAVSHTHRPLRAPLGSALGGWSELGFWASWLPSQCRLPTDLYALWPGGTREGPEVSSCAEFSPIWKVLFPGT